MPCQFRLQRAGSVRKPTAKLARMLVFAAANQGRIQSAMDNGVNPSPPQQRQRTGSPNEQAHRSSALRDLEAHEMDIFRGFIAARTSSRSSRCCFIGPSSSVVQRFRFT
jgi:hypothetical protein